MPKEEMDMYPQPDIDLSRITPAHASAGFRWYVKMYKDHWMLSLCEASRLLDVEADAISRWESDLLAGDNLDISSETIERLSLLLGIHGDIRRITPQNSLTLAVKAFVTPNRNPLFEGLSPKDFLVRDNALDTLWRIRKHYRDTVFQFSGIIGG